MSSGYQRQHSKEIIKCIHPNNNQPTSTVSPKILWKLPKEFPKRQKTEGCRILSLCGRQTASCLVYPKGDKYLTSTSLERKENTRA